MSGLDLAQKVDRLVERGDFAGAADAVRGAYPENSPYELTAIRQFATNVLQSGLKDPDKYERCYAANALAEEGSDYALDLLERVYRREQKSSFDPTLRMAIADGLGTIGDARAVAVLARLYYAERGIDQTIIIQALARATGPNVRLVLTEIASRGRGLGKLIAERGLGRAGNRDTIPLLRKLMGAANTPIEKITLARSLTQLGDTSQADYLLDTLSHPDNYEARIIAILALGEVTEDRAVPLLRDALKEPNPEIRLTAAAALSHHKDTSGVALLRMATRDSDGYIRWRLRNLMREIDFEHGGRDVAIEALDSTDFDLKIEAIGVLGAPGNEAAVPMLKAALKRNGDPIVRTAVALALGRIGGAHCIAPLMELIKEYAPSVRYTAAEGLGRITGRLLAANANDPESKVEPGAFFPYSWSR